MRTFNIHKQSSKRDAINFLLWGLTGSGKSAVKQALPGAIQLVNRRPTSRCKYYRYTLLDGYGIRFEEDAYKHALANITPGLPRRDIKITSYQFVRTPKQLQKNWAAFPSIIHNMDLVEMSDSATQDYTNYLAEMIAVEADCVVVLLDPTVLWQYSTAEYCQYVGLLQKYLSKAPQRSRVIAFCLVKADQFCDWLHTNPRQTIRQIFGSDMLHVIDSFEDIIGCIVKSFCTSAFGFLRNGKPNFDKTMGYMIEPENWNPINIEAPFFWVFEMLELGYLKIPGYEVQTEASNCRLYVRYPQPAPILNVM